MAAAKTALETGDPSALESLLVGRRIWVVSVARESANPDTGGVWHNPPSIAGPYRVLSFQKFLPAGEAEDGKTVRKKHLVKLWTDPGGTRVLSVGSIRTKDPGRVKAGLASAAASRA